MKIGIVLHPFDENRPAGLGRYIFELTKKIIESDSKNQFVIYLKQVSRQKLEIKTNNWQVVVLGSGWFWLEGLAKAPLADFYIFNTPIMPFFFRPKKSLVIALDFAYLDFVSLWQWPKAELLKRYHGYSLKRATKIVAISETTKQEVVSRFKIEQEKIEVIYPGFNPICNLVPKIVAVPDKYFIYVGVIKARKNLLRVVEAFALFLEKLPTHQLLIVGKGRGEYYEQVKDLITKLGIVNKVKFVGYVTDQELSYLYQKAEALVFPSLAEGFGFPVLEAMVCGLPAITSNQTSTKEIGVANSACLVDPKNSREISEAMVKIVLNLEFRNRLIENGRKRAQEFSWQKCATQFIKLINDLQ